MSESGGIMTVLIVLVIVNVIGNSIVCLIIKRNRDMRNPVNYLLINLAIADIIYAVFITPRVFYKLPFTYHPDEVFGVVLCKSLTGGVVAWTGSASAIVTLTAIAIERYYAVMYPHGNKWNLTKRKLKVIISVTWICAVILTLPLMIVKDVIETKSGNSCVTNWPDDWMGKAYSVAWFVGVFIPLIVMIVLYSRVVYALWFKRNDGNQLTQQQKGVVKVRKRVTLMVVAVTAIFGVCFGTSQLVYVLLYFMSDGISADLLAIPEVLILFNSAVNPFVYALLNHQFREKIKRMICCSMAARAHPEPQGTQLADTTTRPTVGTSSTQ